MIGNTVRKMLTDKRYKLLFLIVSICILLGIALSYALYCKNNKEEDFYPLINQALPSFQITDGSIIELSQNDFLKKVSLLHIWASWCDSCKDNHVWLNAVKKLFDVNVYGIGYRCQMDELKIFNAIHGQIYHKNVADIHGDISVHLGVMGTPELLIIDAKGIIRYKFSGKINRKIFDKEISPVIKEYLK